MSTMKEVEARETELKNQVFKLFSLNESILQQLS